MAERTAETPQTVVITGASAGIGRAAARLFAELGPIDVWVNVAFASVFAPFGDISPAEYRRVTEVSYLGFVHGTMAALRRMRDRDHGVIVQVGSALGARSIPLQSAYCGAKHAISGFTSSLRCELMHDRSGVRVTVVQMPAVNTPQFAWVRSRLSHQPQPVPPIYQPEIAAKAVVFAAGHPQRKQYWVGGTTAATVLASRIAPGLLTATWRGLATHPSRPASRLSRAARTTSTPRSTVCRARITELMAALTTGPTAAPSRSGCPSTSGSQSGRPLLPQLRLYR